MIRAMTLTMLALALAVAPALAGNMEIQKKGYGGPNATPEERVEKKGFILQNEAAQKVSPAEQKNPAVKNQAAEKANQAEQKGFILQNEGAKKANMEIQPPAGAAEAAKSPRIGQGADK